MTVDNPKVELRYGEGFVETEKPLKIYFKGLSKGDIDWTCLPFEDALKLD